MSSVRAHRSWGVASSATLLVIACSSGGSVTTPPPPPPPPSVATVTVSAPNANMPVGSTQQLTATARDATGGAISGVSFSWTSSNQAVATVSSSGVVTGVTAGGPVTITATTSGKSGTINVSVTQPPVATVNVTAPSTGVGLGGTMQLTATPRDANNAPLAGRPVTWTSSNQAVATVSATGLVTGMALGGPVTITATSEGKTGTVAISVNLPALRAGWTLRRRIPIATGTAAAPIGYSAMVEFDHAAMVATGKSLASGNDLRVGYWTGNSWVELDRVLDAGSAWNTNTTRVWFKTQTALAANTTDNNYHLHYGNPAAGANAPADPDLVFLFHEDFEDGTLDNWSQAHLFTWANVNTRAHRGARSMQHGPEGPTGRTILVNPALDVGDVYVDAWWNVTSLDFAFNTAQVARHRPEVGLFYTLFCKCIGAGMGFNIAQYVSDEYSDLASPSGNPTPNTWMRVGTALHGQTYRMFFNGQLSLVVNNMTAMASGNVGFSKYIVPNDNQVWIDDVVVRKFAFPEPTATVESEVNTP